MINEKKFNFRDMKKGVVSYSKQKYEGVKDFTGSVAVPRIKETALSTKESVSHTVSKVSSTVKSTITEEQMQEVLNTLYIKSVNGIPKVSVPIDDLVQDYLSKNDNVHLI